MSASALCGNSRVASPPTAEGYCLAKTTRQLGVHFEGGCGKSSALKVRALTRRPVRTSHSRQWLTARLTSAPAPSDSFFCKDCNLSGRFARRTIAPWNQLIS